MAHKEVNVSQCSKICPKDTLALKIIPKLLFDLSHAKKIEKTTLRVREILLPLSEEKGGMKPRTNAFVSIFEAVTNMILTEYKKHKQAFTGGLHIRHVGVSEPVQNLNKN